jgi:hypothetical protein
VDLLVLALVPRVRGGHRVLSAGFLKFGVSTMVQWSDADGPYLRDEE